MHDSGLKIIQTFWDILKTEHILGDEKKFKKQTDIYNFILQAFRGKWLKGDDSMKHLLDGNLK